MRTDCAHKTFSWKCHSTECFWQASLKDQTLYYVLAEQRSPRQNSYIQILYLKTARLWAFCEIFIKGRERWEQQVREMEELLCSCSYPNQTIYTSFPPQSTDPKSNLAEMLQPWLKVISSFSKLVFMNAYIHSENIYAVQLYVKHHSRHF